MARGRINDLEHIQTPPEARGTLWTLIEHETAERAVTIASAALDVLTDDYGRYLFSRLLDARLDHLAEVDDLCEELVGAIGETAGQWAGEAARLHYLRGMTWRAASEAVGMPTSAVTCAVSRAARRLDAR